MIVKGKLEKKILLGFTWVMICEFTVFFLTNIACLLLKYLKSVLKLLLPRL